MVKQIIRVEDDPVGKGPVAAMEVRAARIYADEKPVVKGNHIDPVKREPLIYHFRHCLGLGEELGKNFKAAR